MEKSQMTTTPVTNRIAALVPDADPFAIEGAKATTKKKAGVQSVAFDAERVSAYIKADKDEKDATALKAMLGGLLKTDAEHIRLSLCLMSKSVVQSVLLDGRLQFTAQDKWSKIDPAKGADLQTAFDLFGHFDDRKETKLNMAALAAHKADPEVVAAFALLRSKGVLEQTRWYEPTEQFFGAYCLDADLRARARGFGLSPQLSLTSKEK